MNIRLSLFSAVTCLALAGCMSTNQEQPSGNPNTENLKFAAKLSSSLAEVGETEKENPAFANACPKLLKVTKDLAEALAQQSDEVPASFKDLQDCFDLPPQPTEEDYKKMSDDIEENPAEFLECVCGSGDFSGYDALKWHAFAASASAVAGAAFNASQSNSAGAAYNGSSSVTAGPAYNGSQSNAAGEAFHAE